MSLNHNNFIAVVAGGVDDGMTLSFSTPSRNTNTSTNTTQQPPPQHPWPWQQQQSPFLTPLPGTSAAAAAAPPHHHYHNTTCIGAASRIPVFPSHSNSHMAAAVFYGECSRQGIPPTAAERAALDITGQYRTWWVDAVAKKVESSNGNSNNMRKRGRDEREEDRGVIDRVSGRQQEQGGGYVYPLPRLQLSSQQQTNKTSSSPPQNKNISGVTISVDGQQVPISLSSTSTLPTSAMPCNYNSSEVSHAKSQLPPILEANGGKSDTPEAKAAIQILQSHYLATGSDARFKRSLLTGNWLALCQPAYNGCLGTNVHHHYKYTLGRMSFDMYRPTTLVCSIQASFSTIQIIDDPEKIPDFVPRRLRAEVQKCGNALGTGTNTLRSYTTVVALTIEANQTHNGEQTTDGQQDHNGDDNDNRKPIISHPIRGIMKNHGYMLPDPKVPNRLSIWFTGGTLEVNDEADLEEWKRIFSAQKQHQLGLYDRASTLAARLLLGANLPDTMEQDGTMSYKLQRPIGGHGLAYCDVLYLDDNLRVLRGHGGQVYVCARLAETEGL